MTITHRDRYIMSLIASGHTNTEIAERIHTTPKRARNIVAGIYKKVGIIPGNRAKLAAHYQSTKKRRDYSNNPLV